jgi:hypothetical protein
MQITYSTLLRVVLGIAYLVLTFGFIGPMLLSSKSGIAVGLGILVTFVVPLFVSLAIYNHFSKKPS